MCKFLWTFLCYLLPVMGKTYISNVGTFISLNHLGGLVILYCSTRYFSYCCATTLRLLWEFMGLPLFIIVDIFIITFLLIHTHVNIPIFVHMSACSVGFPLTHLHQSARSCADLNLHGDNTIPLAKPCIYVWKFCFVKYM